MSSRPAWSTERVPGQVCYREILSQKRLKKKKIYTLIKLENLKEMDEFLDSVKQPNLNQEKIISSMNDEIETVTQSLLQNFTRPSKKS